MRKIKGNVLQWTNNWKKKKKKYYWVLHCVKCTDMMVSFMSPWLAHGTKIYSQTLLWMFLWVFKVLDIVIRGLQAKQIAHPNVGGPHPISWRPGLNKALIFPSKGEFCSRQSSGLNCTMGSFFMDLQPADFEFASFHYHMNQFLKINF